MSPQKYYGRKDYTIKEAREDSLVELFLDIVISIIELITDKIRW